MRSFLIFAVLVLLINLSSQAQCVLSVKGTVTDADTRSVLDKATVYLVELKKTVITNEKGEYVISGLCPGDYTLRISHAGCQTQEFHFHLKDDISKNIELPHQENTLKEVVVVGSASLQREGMSGEIRGRELDLTRGLSLGESLQRINGVSVLQTGNNIYKPVIQGLHSSRVLILNNGIRQEGQQWGSEHAPEIDPYIANRLTVIKGAASVRYGGDAIGGIVLVEPRLLRYQKERSGELNLSAFSNNRQGVVSAMLEGSVGEKENNAWRIQATYKRGGNARTPDYWLKNSGVEEMNMSATTGWKKANKGIEVFYSIFHTRIGIFSGSHIGNLTDLETIIQAKQPPSYIRDAEFSYQIDRPYQRVQHHLVKVKAFSEQVGKSRISLTYSAQYNQRREYDITRSETDLPQLELNLVTNMADLVWEHFSEKPWKGSMGVNVMHQDNFTNYRYFIPNYQAIDAGVWAAERFQYKKWQMELGLRYDHRSRFAISDNDKEPFNLLMGNIISGGDPYGTRTFQGLSGTAGLAYRFNDQLRASITGSSAWRSPQMNELFSNGLHHGAARIESGVPDLNPERAYSVLSALVFSNSKWEMDLGIYHKEINGFIYLKPTYPPLLTIRGAFPSFVFDQTDASLNGADFTLGYKFNNHFKSTVKSSWLRAYDRKEKTWLIQMPSDRYQADLQYTFIDGKKLKQSFVALSIQHVTEQKRVPPSGNIEIKQANGGVVMASDYLAPPPAYTLTHVEAGTTIGIYSRSVTFNLSVQNLFDVAYRDYMNAFRYFCLDRGRNISLKLKMPL
jgi:iron complex outermembrane receptor protein